VRDWIREEPDRPAPHRFAARIYEQMGALELAAQSAQCEVQFAPTQASAWERLGRLQLRLFDREAARGALEHAVHLAPSVEGLLDLALIHHLGGDVGGEVSLCEAAIDLDPESAVGWSRYAHALARTERVRDCVEACQRALVLVDDVEVAGLLAQMQARDAHHLTQAAV
jgi:tetratricopeptide (TPR) repeat protein